MAPPCTPRKKAGESSIIGLEGLKNFTHEVKAITCNGCENHCRLTVNTFANGARYIAGNRCDKPLKKSAPTAQYNLYDYKKQLLESYQPCEGPRGTIGIPMGLNMFELLPLLVHLLPEAGLWGGPSPRPPTGNCTLRANTPSPRIRCATPPS